MRSFGLAFLMLAESRLTESRGRWFAVSSCEVPQEKRYHKRRVEETDVSWHRKSSSSYL